MERGRGLGLGLENRAGFHIQKGDFIKTSPRLRSRQGAASSFRSVKSGLVSLGFASCAVAHYARPGGQGARARSGSAGDSRVREDFGL